MKRKRIKQPKLVFSTKKEAPNTTNIGGLEPLKNKLITNLNLKSYGKVI